MEWFRILKLDIKVAQIVVAFTPTQADDEILKKIEEALKDGK